MNTIEAPCAAPVSKSAVVTAVVFSLAVVTLWSFPAFWYNNNQSTGQGYVWFSARTNLPGWEFTIVPVSESAESILVADHIVNGSFTNAASTEIRVYSAERYLKKGNEIGLFSHTPDRCWTAVGWELERVKPDVVGCDVHGATMMFERRIFTSGAQRELVYFGAMVGGKPLPYRLDQHFAASLKRKSNDGGDVDSTFLRLRETRLWGWAWQSFVNRTPLAGPQQFVRISTPVAGLDVNKADETLKKFLPLWLQPANYEAELAKWKASR